MPGSYKLKLILGGLQDSGKTTFIKSDRNQNSSIGVSFESIECFVNEGDHYKFIVWDLKDKARFRFLFPYFCLQLILLVYTIHIRRKSLMFNEVRTS